LVKDLKGSIGAKYDTEILKNMLTKKFGDMRLRDLKKKGNSISHTNTSFLTFHIVLVPSFQLDNMDPSFPSAGSEPKINRRWVPRFFHNLNDSDSLDEKVVDVALRSSAAPTYFGIYQGYVDGGVFANNPALCAITTGRPLRSKLLPSNSLKYTQP
jgi:hypothetical protein